MTVPIWIITDYSAHGPYASFSEAWRLAQQLAPTTAHMSRINLRLVHAESEVEARAARVWNPRAEEAS